MLSRLDVNSIDDLSNSLAARLVKQMIAQNDMVGVDPDCLIFQYGPV